MTKKTFRIGLLGAGYIADWHCRALRSVPGAQLAAVCDQSGERARELAARWGGPRVETDLGAMLAAGGLDAVHILLPPAAHAAAARAVLDAGLAAYLEKPLCVTPADCDELVARAESGARIAVGHNFLFDPRYEQLKADLAQRKLGRIEHVSIVWAKEFGPLQSGPYGGWIFRNPANILLEVGPHAVAHLLDLIGGPPDRLQVETLDEVRLPGGGRFFRRWIVWAFRGQVSAELRLSFGQGYPEHRVEVRGAAGTATVDFDRSTYVLRRQTHRSMDFDRYARTTGEAAAITKQARSTLARYILSKARLVREGNPFGASITRGVARFYASLPQVDDPRLSARFGASVVRTCIEIARAARIDAAERPVVTAPAPVAGPADVLVLGGTGFIGRALVPQLAAAGRRVRVLVRDPNNVPDAHRTLGIDVRCGDLRKHDDLAGALQGVSTVVHLARAQARTWDDFVRHDINVTRAVGEACLAAGVRRLIYTGTTDSYYSGHSETITENTPLDPKIDRRNLYARAKAESERVLFGLHRDAGLPLVVVRPAIVIGPGGDPHHWGIGFWPSPDNCLFWGTGNQPVPLVLATDVADALVRCLDRDGINGETFNLAADPCVSPREYVDALSDALDTWIDARPTATWQFFLKDLAKWGVKWLTRHPERRLPSYRDWKSRTYRARYDCSKAKRVLGWEPVSDKQTLLAAGVRAAALEKN